MPKAGWAPPTTLPTRLRRRAVGVLAAAVALPTALALALPAAAVAAPTPAPAQVSAAAGPTIRSVTWVTDRQIALTINSPVMGVPITVGVLLPRTWNSSVGTGTKYPAFMLLDGFRVPDTSSDWFNMTDIEQFFQDKDALVVTAYGGGGSFYSNWETPDPSVAGTQGSMQWETFWNTELPQVLTQSFRFNGNKAIGGLSMGGTAAYDYATRFPGTYKAAASYSGYLSTTSPFFPQLIQYSISSNTSLSPNGLWGDPATDPQWPAHDPTVQAQVPTVAAALKGTSLYVSAGNGAPGPYDGPSFLGLSANYVGQILEITANYSSQQFTGVAKNLGINVTTDYYNGGTHSWPYWQRQLEQSWPQIATALGIPATSTTGNTPLATGPACSADPLFGTVPLSNQLGKCTTGTYPVPGGIAQDYFGGRAFLATGTTTPGAVKGRIGAKFQDLGGTGGSATNPLAAAPANVNGVSLGLPVNPEIELPGGAFNDFSANNTHIYFSPATDAHEIGGQIYQKWGSLGHETGELGYPTTDESLPALGGPSVGFTEGRYNAFQKLGGQILFSRLGTFEVKGAIAATWLGANGTFGTNGFPTSDETPVAGGIRQTFQVGAYTFLLPNGPVVPS